MRLTRLCARRYRSLYDIDWRLGPLNVLIGPNAGGKSNVLDLLELVRDAAWGHLKESILSRGGITSVFFDGEGPSFSMKLEHEATRGLGRLIYDVEVSRVAKYEDPLVRRESLIQIDSSGAKTPLISRSSGTATFFNNRTRATEKLPMAESLSETALHEFVRIGNPALPQRKYQKCLGRFEVFKHFDTGPNAPVRSACVTSYDRWLFADGSNLTQYLHTLTAESKEFRANLRAAMDAAFAGEFEEAIFAPVADQRIQLKIRWKHLKKPRSASELSDGTIRFLYLISILLDPEPPPLIAIDEPETGLHPRMMAIIAELAVEASRRTQVIFVTHSPDFLDAFGHDAPLSTTVMELADGKSQLHMPTESELRHWLSEYSLGEIFRSGTLEGLV